MNETLNLLRPDLRDLRAYVPAAPDRDVLRLHANESPYDSGAALNRYPEPQPGKLIQRLATLYSLAPASVLPTRGSDDGIDLLLRCFCRAGQDSILICPPTFGMYEIAARLQNAGVRKVPLDTAFAVDTSAVVESCNDTTRLVFICSPNNPTGSLVSLKTVATLCESLAGTALVVVDEAYIEYADADSCTTLIDQCPNLVVLRTLSKAHGLAGARCGALLANAKLIDAIRPAMPPYPLSSLTVDAALAALSDNRLQAMRKSIATIQAARERLRDQLNRLSIVRRTWPSEANFLLAEVRERKQVLDACRRQRILIRDMAGQVGLEQHVRITVGTTDQNQRLLQALGSLS